MLFKLSNLNSNPALTLGYLNPALNSSAQEDKYPTPLPHTYSHTLRGPPQSDISELTQQDERGEKTANQA